jgi:hypothetical protein
MSLKRYRTDTGAPWPYPASRDPVGVYGQDGSLYIGALPPRMAYDAANGLDPSSAGYRHPSEPSTFQPARELPATSAAGMGQREATDQGDGGEGNRGARISRARAHAIWSTTCAKTWNSPAMAILSRRSWCTIRK